MQPLAGLGAAERRGALRDVAGSVASSRKPSTVLVAAWASTLATAAVLSQSAVAGTSVFERSDTTDASACHVNVLGYDNAAEREKSLAQQNCGGDHLQVKLQTADKPVATIPNSTQTSALGGSPGPMNAQMSTTMSERFSLFRTDVHFGWAGARNDLSGRMRIASANVAATGSVMLDSNWMLQAGLGREMSTGPRTRTTLASVWQPVSQALVYAEWAGIDGVNDGQLVGGRWWLVPKRLAIDIGAKHAADGTGWSEQRVAITLQSELR
jgi:hypothetical protein